MNKFQIINFFEREKIINNLYLNLFIIQLNFIKKLIVKK
jgi:hypothetical protein